MERHGHANRDRLRRHEAPHLRPIPRQAPPRLPNGPHGEHIQRDLPAPLRRRQDCELRRRRGGPPPRLRDVDCFEDRRAQRDGSQGRERDRRAFADLQLQRRRNDPTDRHPPPVSRRDLQSGQGGDRRGRRRAEVHGDAPDQLVRAGRGREGRAHASVRSEDDPPERASGDLHAERVRGRNRRPQPVLREHGRGLQLGREGAPLDVPQREDLPLPDAPRPTVEGNQRPDRFP
mmetsp:Transcript_17885/g.43759  ORF Transcript_17885/g.43759 Transcript_17885/m.43759 type:complete len:232 (-) Transcript_17885:396-1091(-)